MLVHAPGLKVVMPAAPADFPGLLRAAIRDDNPVIFLTDLGLLAREGDVPVDEAFLVPLGQAKLCRSGDDVTLVSYAKTVGVCLEAAQALGDQGVSAEVKQAAVPRAEALVDAVLGILPSRPWFPARGTESLNR